MKLSSEENIQYSRHLILDEIGVVGQKKLKAARVLVVGAGGLGCPVLQYLTASGVGTIGIIDHDTIDQTNLQRQILYKHKDIGKLKAEVAANNLSELNPFINFEIYTQKLTKELAVKLFSKYDIIVDGSDNFPTRFLVNDASVLTGKPVVFGSVFKFEGQISVFNYQNGATYRCLYPAPPKPNEVPNCSEIGVLGVLPGIIGVLQANEVLKIICDIGEVLSGKLLTYNALTMQQSILNFQKDKTVQIFGLEMDYELFCGLPKENLEISFSELKESSKEYILLDVRTDFERQEYNIGGIHIPLHKLEERSGEIPVQKDVVVYCKSGMRSKKAIEILKNKGIENLLINLKGGISSN